MTETPVSHARLTFALIIVAFFMDTIDASIVQVALPTIRNAFGASIADSQWAFGAYAITLAGFTMLMGMAGDVYGQKRSSSRGWRSLSSLRSVEGSRLRCFR